MVSLFLSIRTERAGRHQPAPLTIDSDRQEAEGRSHEEFVKTRGPGHRPFHAYSAGWSSLSTNHLWLVISMPSIVVSTMYTVSSVELSIVASAPSMPGM